MQTFKSRIFVSLIFKLSIFNFQYASVVGFSAIAGNFRTENRDTSSVLSACMMHSFCKRSPSLSSRVVLDIGGRFEDVSLVRCEHPITTRRSATVNQNRRILFVSMRSFPGRKSQEKKKNQVHQPLSKVNLFHLSECKYKQ